ncbi:MAG TPA: chemotaxis protein CheD [Cellvibrio sp.]|nr:chemotaxis protein CheD [Cellvibrio sp.]
MTAARDLKRLHSIHPGDWYFGTEYKRLHTVLGSCVALTAWHPKFKVGGLCHYLLASLPDSRGVARDCRYAVNALEQMRLAMLAFGRPHDFELGLFGGGDMFAFATPTSIGADNIQFAREWLIRERLRPRHIDVGGTISRSLTLVMATGEIQLKHYQMNAG